MRFYKTRHFSATLLFEPHLPALTIASSLRLHVFAFQLTFFERTTYDYAQASEIV
jgi:hypothetical protein